MAIRFRDVFMGELKQLRYEPVDKRIRGTLAGRTIVDSRRAMLVWEPKRVVPSYAVPVEDLSASTTPDVSAPGDAMPFNTPMLGDRPVLDPSVPFSVHTATGESLTLRGPEGEYASAAFRAPDAALNGYLILDFGLCDAWYEEDELNIGHPRDPFHRIEVVHSSRHVQVLSGSTVIAESSRPFLLQEAPLPARYYLPVEDVRTELLTPSAKESVCAYKGRARYWSLPTEPDIVWSYPEPMREAAEIKGRLAFLNEQVDLVVDGEPIARPVTPWSRRAAN